MSAGRWAGGIAISAALHVAAAGALALAVQPRETPQQPVPETALDLAAYAVDRTEAAEAQPDAEAAAAGEAEGSSVGSADIPRVDARPMTSPMQGIEVVAPDAPVAEAAAVAVDTLEPETPEGATQTAQAPETETARPTEATSQDIAQAEPEVVTAEDQAVEPEAASAIEPAIETAKAVAQPASVVATSVAAPSAVVAAAVAAPSAVVAAAVAVPSAVVAAAVASPSAIVATAVASPTAVVATAVAAPNTVVAASLPQPAAIAVTAADAPVISAIATPAPVAAVAAALPVAAPVREAQAPEADVLAVQEAAPAPLATVTPTAFAAPPAEADAPQAQPQAAPSEEAPPADTSERATAATDVPPPAEFAKAALAWAGQDGAMDPVSLAAIQSFMQPSDLGAAGANAGTVRDGIAGFLSNVPCARLQAAFVPETGALELRGHIPEEGLRGPVLTALQQQVGGSIQVTDNVLILPRPQCGALAGIANVGLPQSTEALNNPLIVGPDAHAVVYGYVEEDDFAFTMQAPDYDAYVYVDYFMADGNVLHLLPNEYLALERRTADSVVQIGQDPCIDYPFCITVAPPFGQEIAAAFASSSPLYDGLRPIVEPAEGYLAFLTERVAEARARDPGFKGEWVYFFIETSGK